MEEYSREKGKKMREVLKEVKSMKVKEGERGVGEKEERTEGARRRVYF